jgi:hypothetical protein
MLAFMTCSSQITYPSLLESFDYRVYKLSYVFSSLMVAFCFYFHFLQDCSSSYWIAAPQKQWCCSWNLVHLLFWSWDTQLKFLDHHLGLSTSDLVIQCLQVKMKWYVILLDRNMLMLLYLFRLCVNHFFSAQLPGLLISLEVMLTARMV